MYIVFTSTNKNGEDWDSATFESLKCANKYAERETYRLEAEKKEIYELFVASIDDSEKYEEVIESLEVINDIGGTWYAVMQDNEADDWSEGSHLLEKAERILSEYLKSGFDDAYIAVIKDLHENPTCIGEIR